MTEPLSPEALAFLPVFAEFVELVRAADVAAIQHATGEHQAAAAAHESARREAEQSLAAAVTRHTLCDERHTALEAEEKRVRSKDEQLTILIAETEQKGHELDRLKAKHEAEHEENVARLAADRALHEDKVATDLAALKARERRVSEQEAAAAKGIEAANALKAEYERKIADLKRLAG